MKSYYITRDETRTYCERIDAESEDEAISQFEALMAAGKIDLCEEEADYDVEAVDVGTYE